MLTNPYFIALGIPIVLLFSGAVAKKLVRGSTWVRSDFFLGVELALAAMSAALVFLFDLSTGQNTVSPALDKVAATGGFLALCFFLLLWIMSTHQDWEARDEVPRKQIIRLGVLANGIGAGLLVTFVLLVKGVS